MSDNQGEFSKSCHFQMMVYILCVDASSGVEELDLVREELKLCEVKERHLTATEETAS